MKFARVMILAGTLAGIGALGIATAAGTAQQQGAGAPKATPAAAPASTGAESFKVDPVHSAVIFKIKRNDVSNFYGRFNGLTGSWNLDGAAPEKSSMEFSIKTESVDSGNPKRDDHLKTADFFNAKEFPTISFKSTKVTKKGDNKYEVAGDLTLHGVTKPITVALEHTGTATGEHGTQSGVEATFTIKRSDFGVGTPGRGLADEVSLIVGIAGVGGK
jgi:polyisoprenoid-binding protein YceI